MSDTTDTRYERRTHPPAKCPRCRYDLNGLPSPHHCPECGFAYDDHLEIWRAKGSIVIKVFIMILLTNKLFVGFLILRETIRGNERTAKILLVLASVIWFDFMMLRYVLGRKIIIAPEGALVQGWLYGWQYVRWADVAYKEYKLPWKSRTGFLSRASLHFGRRQMEEIVSATERRIDEFMDSQRGRVSPVGNLNEQQ
jgi:hypothetical protein